MTRRYSWWAAKQLLRHPSKIPKAVRLALGDLSNPRKIVGQLALEVNSAWYARRQYPRTNPVSAEWDNLIIIDGARPDLLRDVGGEYRDIETRYSPASCSSEFMEVLNAERLHDTVYVTANPNVARLDNDVFHAIINLLETDWDADAETVQPADVVERAMEAHRDFPKKRLVVHFMQPHFPFLGPTGQEIDAGITDELGERTSPHPWQEQMWGEKPGREKLVVAFRENHDIVMPHVERLLDELDGRSIVTADHANLIGERGFPFPFRLYGHPEGLHHPALLRVPWMERNGERREVTATEPRARNELESAVLNDRLESLGYR